jgi:hypothetical protein
MGGSSLSAARAATIERKARQISDPVERLRYLRRATAAASDSHGRGRRIWITMVVLTASFAPLTSDATGHKAAPRRQPQAPLSGALSTADVWAVEKTQNYEVYSSGLRIENQYQVNNEPRAYTLFDREGAPKPGADQAKPAGILFHTTESDQAPFERENNRALQRIGKDLLNFVRGKRAYHFVIDRFGRVFRIVVESDTAYHAGHSIWADSESVYLDLNESFLGVSFEGRTQADQPITDAQVRSGAVLTEMLRSKYGIPAGNCVTHAQVSVNPSNMRIGWHTDWGSGFPFRQLGLPDNYDKPNPAFTLFGFEYDQVYIDSTGPVIWKNFTAAEERMRTTAREKHLTLGQYRRSLQQKYSTALGAPRHRSAVEEN